MQLYGKRKYKRENKKQKYDTNVLHDMMAQQQQVEMQNNT